MTFPAVQVFDPPMCCSSGVCGPDVDPALTRFSADLDWLGKQGVTVERFNLAQQPQAFVGHPQVVALLRETGNAALPVVLCQGAVIAKGHYPSREALATAAGLPPEVLSRPAPARLPAVLQKCEPGTGCC